MKNILVIGFLCCVFNINAQDTLYLSHNKILQMVKNQNLKIQSNELNYKLAKSSFYKSIGESLPTLGMGLKRYELSGYTQNSTGEFIVVNKDNEWTGNSFRLNWNLSSLLFNSVAEKKSMKAAFYLKQLKNIDEKVKVFSSYYLLVASEEKEKAISSFVDKNTEIIQQLKLQVTAGLRLQSELLLAQSNLNNLKIQLLKQEQNTKELSQNLLASLNTNENYILKTDCNFYAINTSDTDDEILFLLNKHYSLRYLEMEIASAKLKKNKELYGLLFPEISFGINDGLLGPINQDAFGNQKIMTSTLQWNIPLGSIFPAGKYKSKNYLYKIKLLEKQQVENDLKATMNSLISASNSAEEQYRLAKQSAEFSKLAYKQSLQRQALGTATQLELFHAEKEYLNAKLIYIDAIAYKQEIAHHKMAIFSKNVMQ